ncbi:MAG TPA: lipid II flippase MurJ [Ignavibacteria bacterium]|nr:hypothetical protein [Bacteroidota bacterium]HRE11526.1 lipid II flippase MurJ [Ignavibacteria bacterium]HRF66629.1 lipid II flippase MurJ [Ignavibacteria bacterium]HRJ04483.1 lipid II flippase MurJ [Ignavibacteria bacterium]
MHKIYRTFSVLLLITVLLKLLDVIKNLIIVSKLGVTDNADVYWALISLPEGIIVLLGFDTIRGVSNSEYSSIGSEKGLNNLLESFQTIFKLLIIVSPMVFIVLFVFREDIIRLLLPGFGEEKLHLSYSVSMFIFPILFFKIIAGFMVSVNNSVKKFYFPALVSIVISISIIVSIFLNYYENELIFNLSIAALFGNLIYTLLLILGSKEFFRTFRLFELKIDDVTKKILKASSSIIVLVIFNQLYLFSRNYFVSYFPDGAISSVNYAGTLPGILNMLIFSTVFSVTLSHLSSLFHDGKNSDAKSLFWSTILRLLFLVVPLIALFLSGNKEILSLLFLRGSFNLDALSKVDVPFIWESLAMLSVVLSLMSTSLFLARKKYLELTLIGSAVYIGGICLNYLASYLFGYYGVSIAGFVTTALFAIVMILRTRNLWDNPWQHINSLTLILASGVITMIGALLFEWLLELFAGEIQGLVINLVLKASFVSVVYLLVTSYFKVNFLKEIKHFLKSS